MRFEILDRWWGNSRVNPVGGNNDWLAEFRPKVGSCSNADLNGDMFKQMMFLSYCGAVAKLSIRCLSKTFGVNVIALQWFSFPREGIHGDLYMMLALVWEISIRTKLGSRSGCIFQSWKRSHSLTRSWSWSGAAAVDSWMNGARHNLLVSWYALSSSYTDKTVLRLLTNSNSVVS